jgi:carbamoyl-phosphate synthase small subunit
LLYENIFFDATYDDLASFSPDGFFLSNGSGDPEPLLGAIQVAKEIINNNAIIWNLFSHQVIGLANGISTYKMFNGHRGIKSPCQEFNFWER